MGARMRALVVSYFDASAPTTLVAGVYQRLDMFVTALCEVADVELLMYRHHFVLSEAKQQAALAASVAERWGPDVRLTTAVTGHPRSRVERAGAALVSTRTGTSYSSRHRPGVAPSSRSQIAALDACLARRPDLVFAHRLSAMAPIVRSREPCPPVLFDLDDVEHLRAQRDRSNGVARRLGASALLRRAERVASRHADVVCVTSEIDQLRMQRVGRGVRVEVVPNSVTMPAISELEGVSATSNLMFLGTYNYAPNARAAEWLITEIWPKVQSRVPAAQLTIAGEAPERIPSHADRPSGVHFAGHVDDLGALYRSTAVVCVPILDGGGTRIKVIEAAGHGRPMVATSVAVEGLDLHHGEDLVIGDNPHAFADAVVLLLQDPDRAAGMGRSARDALRAVHERDVVHAKVVAIASTLAAGTGSAPNAAMVT